jgi:hypothetical protein
LAGGYGVAKSNNSGDTWVRLDTGSYPATALAIDPNTPATLYAGTSNGGVFKTFDAGTTWAPANPGLVRQTPILALLVDYVTPSTVYAGLQSGVWQLRGTTGAFYTVTPCRALDTRSSEGGPILAAGAARTLRLVGNCGIPSDAASVSMNVTATGATSAGHLRLYPAATPLAPNSSLNFSPGQTRANNAVSSLGAAGDLSIFSGQPSGSVHIIVDVNGYFQ